MTFQRRTGNESTQIVNPQCTANGSIVAETWILVDIARKLMV